MRALIALSLLCGGCSLLLEPGDNNCAATTCNEPDEQPPPDATPQVPASNAMPCLGASFSAPEIVTVMIDGLAETDDLLSPSLTGDMETMYFNVHDSDVDVWEASNIGDGLVFGPATMLASVSDDGQDDDYPKISEDGMVLRFVSDRIDLDDGEIYEAHRDAGMLVWQAPTLVRGDSDHAYPPIPLPASASHSEVWSLEDRLEYWQDPANDELLPVNALGQVNGPWISRDGLVLYFAHDESPHALFYSVRATVDAPWLEPTEVPGLQREPGQSDSDPWLSSDLCTLYFSRETRDMHGSLLSRNIVRAVRAAP